MTIINIVEQWDGRGCSKILDKYERKYARKFRVTCTPDASDDLNTILGTSPLPVVGSDTYPSDVGALCISSSLTQHQNFYDITYQYDSEVPVPNQQNPDPLDRPPIYSTSYQKVDKPLIEDLDDLPILNSADQPFENPITVPSSMLLIQIEMNYDYGDKTLLDFGNLVDTINEASWVTGIGTFPAYSCRMDAIEAKINFEDNIEYWNVNYKILYNPELWFPYKILDCGFATVDVVTGNLIQITDDTGAPVSKPQLLDGMGGRDSTPHYLDFNVYTQADWTGVP